MRSVGCTLKKAQSKCHVREAPVLTVGTLHAEAGALFLLEPPTVASEEVLVGLGHEASYRVVDLLPVAEPWPLKQPEVEICGEPFDFKE